jgi:hypothetical protein
MLQKDVFLIPRLGYSADAQRLFKSFPAGSQLLHPQGARNSLRRWSCLLCADGMRSRMIRQDAGRGALPRDRRRTSEHGEQGYLTGNAPSRIGYGEEFTVPSLSLLRCNRRLYRRRVTSRHHQTVLPECLGGAFRTRQRGRSIFPGVKPG